MAYTRAQIRTLIQQRCDIENTTAQGTAELNNHINDAAAYVHDFLIGTLGDKYGVATDGFITTSGTATYDLSLAIGDLYIPLAFRLSFDDESFPLDAYSDMDRILRPTATSWGPSALPQYRVTRSAENEYEVTFDPAPAAVHTVTVRYHTIAPEYVADGQLVGIPHHDLLIAEACIRVKQKEERDASSFKEERAMIQKRIEDWVGAVDMGNVPQTLVIPRRRSYVGRRGRIF